VSAPAGLDSAALARWAGAARDALEAARAEIDDLNVYPVPDGDTGTNMHLTLAAAVAELSEAPPEGASESGSLARLAHGALMGARGNSGVILSQLLRGLADGLAGTDRNVGPVELAAAFEAAARAAYDAVAVPVEGTMLTVARAAAEGARDAAGRPDAG